MNVMGDGAMRRSGTVSDADAAVAGRVRRLVEELAPMLDAQASGSSLLVDDLGYDSLGLLELAAAIEREFELPALSERDAMDVRSVDDVERLVVGLLRA
jgi:acyl carrier protein